MIAARLLAWAVPPVWAAPSSCGPDAKAHPLQLQKAGPFGIDLAEVISKLSRVHRLTTFARHHDQRIVPRQPSCKLTHSAPPLLLGVASHNEYFLHSGQGK